MLIARAILYWNAYVARSPLRRLGHAALVAAATSLLSKVLGFAKEVVVAATFGLSGALDIYLVAFVLIGMPLSILLNAVQTALIVHLSSGLDRDTAASRFSATCLLTLIILAGLLPIWLWVLPHVLPWLTSGFSSDNRQALQAALYWLIPYYFLNGFNLLGYGTLQANGRFLANGLLPVVTPVAIMLAVLVLGSWAGWQLLAVALGVGTAMESLLLMAALSRLGVFSSQIRPSLRGLAPITMASLALLPGTFVQAIGPLVEQAIAAAMGEGSNAALVYGNKLPAALLGILLTPLGITTLPYFSAQIGQGNYAYSLHSLNKIAGWLLAGGTLLALPLGIFSSEIVALFYQRGAFDAAATKRVAPIQFAYFMQIPFALVSMLGFKTLAALNLNGLLCLYMALGVLLQALLAYVLTMRYGLPSIAWAAVIVSALLAIASYFTACRSLRRLSR
ncbi:murein biosynthesis integral membrane protein MurJ [Nitrospira calida]